MEQISLGYRSKESRQQRSGSSQTKIFIGKDLLKELEQRRSSPSVVAKLIGIDVLPPPQVAMKQQQEFKDVFEVSEPSETTRGRSHHVGKGLPSLKRSTLQLKKIVPAKSPLSDEIFDGNVEWRDGLDRSNPLERSNPLFENCPYDLKYSANHHVEKDATSAFRKLPVGLAHSSLRELSSLHHVPTTRGEYDNFNSIVVLEPSSENACSSENIPASYVSDAHKICTRNREQKHSELLMLHKGRVPRHFLDTEDVSGPRVRRERYLTNNAIDTPHLIGQNCFAQSSKININSSGSSQRCSNCSNNCNLKQSNRISSESFSMKISLRHEDDADGGSKTLAEMFALSDSEGSRRILDSHSHFKHDKLDGDSGTNREGCFIVLPKYAPYSCPTPLQSHSSWVRTIVSNDNLLMRKDTTRLRGAHSSREGSQDFGKLTSISYKGGRFQFHIFKDEPRLLKQKTSIRQEKLRNVVGTKPLIIEKQKPIYRSHGDPRSDSQHLDENFSASECINEKVLFTTDEGLVRKPADSARSAKDLMLIGEHKVTSPFQYQEEDSVTHFDHASTTKPLQCSKEAEQPSPVSILEPPTDEESSCSWCFKYNVEDIPIVQTQINELEPQDESKVSMSSDDDNDSATQSLEAFLVEEDRDFSYLLDILISSGIIVSNFELLYKTWHSRGRPVGPHVFDKLERKYSKIATWLRPERRLLFDIVNSVLSEVLAPCIDTHPWTKSRMWIRPIWGPEGPVEKVWQMLVRQREELVVGYPEDKVLDPKWLEVGDDINMVGKQIGRMLCDDLLEEAIVEFLSGSDAS